MYNLQKYSGPASRHTCPQCGQAHKFTLYVDENGEPLHPTVGRCDRESACGYHYTPKQYFADHPEEKPGKDWWEDRPAWLDKPAPKPLCTLPDHIVTRSVRQNYDSDLITFLRTFLDPIVIEDLIDEYRIGVTKSRATIFFQMDAQGRCRTGKIMMYDPETGHRIKDPNVPGRITWVHSMMKQAGMLPADWELTQCLFGEHLLPRYPKKPVALVESEKTSIICAGLMPKYLWLATGGKSCINDRLLVLQGRKVIAFPDIDGYEDWSRKLSAYPQLGITISPILNQNATAEDLAAHIDIADWLIRSRGVMPGSDRASHSRDFLRAARYVSPEYHNELEAMIQDLDLEFMGAERIEDAEAPEQQ